MNGQINIKKETAGIAGPDASGFGYLSSHKKGTTLEQDEV
jgi:hypothetical protein